MPGDEATPEPDEGRDSYGIRLDSQSPDTYTVDLTVEQPWEEEVVFEETLTVEGATTRTWSGVITDPVEHSVRAAIESEAGETDTASTFVTPGQENSPPDTWVQVRIRQVDTHSGTVPGVSVFLESRS